MSRRGLYGKYYVEKMNGKDSLAEQVTECFVLRVDRDPFAIPALRSYADACQDQNPVLAADLRRWVASFDQPEAPESRGGERGEVGGEE